jgi:hypothetical protein
MNRNPTKDESARTRPVLDWSRIIGLVMCGLSGLVMLAWIYSICAIYRMLF